MFKSSSSQMFFKIGVLKNFAIFTGKHLCWSLFNKVAGWEACNFFEKETPTHVSSCEYCKVFKNSFFTEHLQCLLLNIFLIR